MFNRQSRFLNLNKKGFTLIEMLVVMTIIGVLAGLILTGFDASRKTARDGRRMSDLEQIRSALEMYRADNASVYPAALATLVPTYIAALPADPRGYTYYYNRTSSYAYDLCAYLETGGSDNCGNNCSAPGGAVCNYKKNNP